MLRVVLGSALVAAAAAGRLVVGSAYAVSLAGDRLTGTALDSGEAAWATALAGPAARRSLTATRVAAADGHPEEVAVLSVFPNATSQLAYVAADTGAVLGTRFFDNEVVRVVPLQTRDETQRAHLLSMNADGTVTALQRFPRDVFVFSVDAAANAAASFHVAAPLDDAEAPLRPTKLASIAFPADEAIVAYTSLAKEATPRAQILGDDSILLKYLSGSSAAVASLSAADGASELHVSLVDTITGRVLHRFSHPDGAEPVSLLQSENWLFYTYWNTKSHRNEIGVVTLYEGMINRLGLNPFKIPGQDPAPSSFGDQAPAVLQQTFVLPHSVSGLGITKTVRGVTAKHLLVAFDTGQIAMFDRRSLDPRRPKLSVSDSERAEGLALYAPFLQCDPYNVVTKNETGGGWHSVETRGEGLLESTTVVVAAGAQGAARVLRVCPSQKFDTLEGFSYFALVGLLAGLAVLAVFLKRAAAAKATSAAWL